MAFSDVWENAGLYIQMWRLHGIFRINARIGNSLPGQRVQITREIFWTTWEFARLRLFNKSAAVFC
jgi:hypothetical protein